MPTPAPARSSRSKGPPPSTAAQVAESSASDEEYGSSHCTLETRRKIRRAQWEPCIDPKEGSEANMKLRRVNTSAQGKQVVMCHLSKIEFSEPFEQMWIRRRVTNAKRHRCESFLLYSTEQTEGQWRRMVHAAVTLRINTTESGRCWAQVMNMSVWVPNRSHGTKLYEKVERELSTKDGIDVVCLYPVVSAERFWWRQGMRASPNWLSAADKQHLMQEVDSEGHELPLWQKALNSTIQPVEVQDGDCCKLHRAQEEEPEEEGLATHRRSRAGSDSADVDEKVMEREVACRVAGVDKDDEPACARGAVAVSTRTTDLQCRSTLQGAVACRGAGVDKHDEPAVASRPNTFGGHLRKRRRTVGELQGRAETCRLESAVDGSDPEGYSQVEAAPSAKCAPKRRIRPSCAPNLLRGCAKSRPDRGAWRPHASFDVGCQEEYDSAAESGTSTTAPPLVGGGEVMIDGSGPDSYSSGSCDGGKQQVPEIAQPLTKRFRNLEAEYSREEFSTFRPSLVARPMYHNEMAFVSRQSPMYPQVLLHQPHAQEAHMMPPTRPVSSRESRPGGSSFPHFSHAPGAAYWIDRQETEFSHMPKVHLPWIYVRSQSSGQVYLYNCRERVSLRIE
eukprot:gnl/TRDRNA2_/TRDRNA2_41934_c0_seq1.p1 gnl/TRDRNA2_/TRDRNA2_41934_c0~~gnl/TRDRNA2_/TRDRNA2_41934_c0_seq1.p1  ORF type:complete len:618 (+),score=93.55 gnl/TRDRNA2_/TRDRNA2_41934_c0_seq1:148-2001(+)